jgi:hypothetical protein
MHDSMDHDLILVDLEEDDVREPLLDGPPVLLSSASTLIGPKKTWASRDHGSQVADCSLELSAEPFTLAFVPDHRFSDVGLCCFG